MYKQLSDQVIQRITDNTFIPTDPRNRDYQKYLKWINERNKPLPNDPPVRVIPQEISMRQARLALHSVGKLVSVGSVIEGLNEPDRTAAKIEWEYSSALRRDNRFIKVLGTALGLDDAAIDELFVSASKL